MVCYGQLSVEFVWPINLWLIPDELVMDSMELKLHYFCTRNSERSGIRSKISTPLDNKMGIQPEGMVSTLFLIVILENNIICCNKYNFFSRSMVSRETSNRGRKFRLDIKRTNKINLTASQ